jgi:hypothetical protein
MRQIYVFSAVLLAAAALNAQRKEPFVGPAIPVQPREAPPGVAARLARPAPFSLGSLNVSENAVLTTRGRIPRIGVHRSLPAISQLGGKWETLADGTALWRLTIQSPGATGLRIQFGDFAVGAGKVWIYSGPDVSQAQGPFTKRGTFENGEFWSGTTWGDTAVVEYRPADSKDRSVPFQIRALSHRVTARPGATALGATTWVDPAASCNLDVTCYSDWSSAAQMVSEINFQTEEDGQQFEAACTASLVATRDNNLKPYLLTAGHCIHNEPDARTIETYWTYQTSQCSGPAPLLSDSITSQVGGDYLLSGALETGDYSLVLLKNVPSGVLYSGWDPAEIAVGTNVVGIHHPEASYKRILFGHRSDDYDVQIGSDQLPSDLYYIVTLDAGIAQPGSSGSPIFTAPGVIVGTLTWGPDLDGAELCAAGSFDIGYGRFSVAYPNFMNWLEDLPYSEVLSANSNVTFTGLNGVIAGGPQQTVNLTTQATNPVTFGIRSDANWIKVSAPASTVSASQPTPLTITINPSMLNQAGTYAGTVTILSGAAPPQFINVNATIKMDISNVVASASPNPVQQGSDGYWSYTVQLKESAGVSTQLTRMRIDGRDYTSDIASWFGSTQLPAGGTLQAPLKANVFAVPDNQIFEIWGVDNASGKNWYRSLTVSLIGK